jgi:mannobiose 2-epimerase
VILGCIVAAMPTHVLCGEPVDSTPSPEVYLRLADEVEAQLTEGLLPLWYPRCVDREHGGFYSNFREDWSPGDKQHKTIVYQARMTWLASQVALRYPELAAEYREYARHGLDFLAGTMWDDEDGGFFWGLDEAGRITPAYGTEKHLYGMSFGIYAAAAAYRATKDERALDLGKRAFAWLEEHAHDPANGGYCEAYTRSGQRITDAWTDPGGRRHATDALGTHYGFKSMNGHIHLLEALTALYGVWPDAAVRTRLDEVFRVVRDKVAVEPGCLNLYFTPDWRAVPDHDSFGHDVETTYLLLEAAEALGEGEGPQTLRVARSLVDHALEWGWDDVHGGFYDRGFAFHPAYGLEKIWWTQAEGLNALLLSHERFGGGSSRYFEAFVKQWRFIVDHQIDARHGGWHGSVARDGTAEPGKDKATIWKAAYHDGRALMEVSERLRRLARPGADRRPAFASLHKLPEFREARCCGAVPLTRRFP